MTPKDGAFIFDGINPQPWTASEGAVNRRGGKMYVQFHKPAQLVTYQESIQAAWEEHYGDLDTPLYPKGTNLKVEFIFWRQIETKETQGRKSVSGQADATNLLKSTEDALQGLLFANDRDNVSVESTIAEQGPDVTPLIIVSVQVMPDLKFARRLLIKANGIISARNPVRKAKRDRSRDAESF